MTEKLTFPTPYRGDSEWTLNGRVFTSEENLASIKDILENRGSVILEHWHFYGSRAPDRFIFDDYDELIDYLKKNAIAGDAIHTWSMHDLCTDQNELVSGKCPDDQGRIPIKGAY